MAMDTYRNNLLQNAEHDKCASDAECFVSGGDLSDYKQYQSSRRRQVIFKVALVGVVVVILVTALAYFVSKMIPGEKEGKLRACKGDEDNFHQLPGKCFAIRVYSKHESLAFYDSLAACKRQCVSLDWCYSVDFYDDDGECYTYSALSSEVSGDEFVDTRSARHGLEKAEEDRFPWCSHYDRVCM